MAIAPPLTFTFAMSSPSSRITARDWAAKASFSSIMPISSSVSPAFSSTLRTAGTGPMPMTRGSTPTMAWATMRAIGLTPSSFTFSPLISSRAAPASLRPHELPAVTLPLPLVRNTGLSLARPSMVVALGCSSVSNTMGSFFRWGITTGTISSLNTPAATASAALRWLWKAN